MTPQSNYEQAKAEIVNSLLTIQTTLQRLGGGKIIEITMPHHNETLIKRLFYDSAYFYMQDIGGKGEYICGVKINYEI